MGHCNYDRGSCQPEDQSMLVWELAQGEECEYQPWQNSSGKILNKHFVSKDRALALTFEEHVLNFQSTCKGEAASLRDHGVLIQFNTPLKNQWYKNVSGNITWPLTRPRVRWKICW